MKYSRATVMAVFVLTCPQAIAEDFPASLADNSSITLEEVRAHSQAVFDAFAGQSGGAISEETFLSADIPPGILASRTDRSVLKRLFKVLDANADGTLTRQEWKERISKDLDAADMNDDGKITVEELATAREKMGLGGALEMLL